MYFSDTCSNDMSSKESQLPGDTALRNFSGESNESRRREGSVTNRTNTERVLITSSSNRAAVYDDEFPPGFISAQSLSYGLPACRNMHQVHATMDLKSPEPAMESRIHDYLHVAVPSAKLFEPTEHLLYQQMQRKDGNGNMPVCIAHKHKCFLEATKARLLKAVQRGNNKRVVLNIIGIGDDDPEIIAIKRLHSAWRKHGLDAFHLDSTSHDSRTVI